MKCIHSISVRVFVKDNEDCEELRNVFLSLFPFDLEKEKLLLNEESTESLAGGNITILRLRLEKQRHIKEFMKKLLSELDADQRSLLLSQKESRLDEEINFFIRLLKGDLVKGSYKLTDSGNCFHITLGIAAYPAKRENALKTIENIFK